MRPRVLENLIKGYAALPDPRDVTSGTVAMAAPRLDYSINQIRQLRCSGQTNQL